MKSIVEQLKEIAPLAAAATEGPWRAEMDFESDIPMILSGFGKVANVDDINFGNEFGDDELSECQPEDNAVFIAAARNLLTPENIALLLAPAPSSLVGEQAENYPDYYTPIILNKAHNSLKLLLELINLMLPKVPKSKMDGDERNDVIVIFQTAAELIKDLREQEKKLTDKALALTHPQPVKGDSSHEA